MMVTYWYVGSEVTVYFLNRRGWQLTGTVKHILCFYWLGLIGLTSYCKISVTILQYLQYITNSLQKQRCTTSSTPAGLWVKCHSELSLSTKNNNKIQHTYVFYFYQWNTIIRYYSGHVTVLQLWEERFCLSHSSSPLWEGPHRPRAAESNVRLLFWPTAACWNTTIHQIWTVRKSEWNL